jgi:hypothetical protein
MTPLNQKSAGEFMAKSGGRFVVMPSAAMEKTFPSPPATWNTFTNRGFNLVKGKDVDLTLVLKPE